VDAHGETTVTVEGLIVRSQPQDGTNKEGLVENWEKILKAASGMDRWILWADIGESFALTPASLNRVVYWFRKSKENGCIGIGVTVSNVMVSYYTKSIEEQVQIPIKASDSVQELKAFFQELKELSQ